MTTKTQVIVTKPIKNLGVALILSALFGPLGMLYATIMGAIIMAVVYGLICLFTFGLGLTVIWLLNPICMRLESFINFVLLHSATAVVVYNITI